LQNYDNRVRQVCFASTPYRFLFLTLVCNPCFLHKDIVVSRR
jgi:hypothetical protein